MSYFVGFWGVAGGVAVASKPVFISDVVSVSSLIVSSLLDFVHVSSLQIISPVTGLCDVGVAAAVEVVAVVAVEEAEGKSETASLIFATTEEAE